MSGESEGGEPGDRPLDKTKPATAVPTTNSAVRYVRSIDLFGGATEVVIEHAHHRYRLKMTSRGGLILSK
jgi:hemin uptake protein HemP